METQSKGAFGHDHGYTDEEVKANISYAGKQTTINCDHCLEEEGEIVEAIGCCRDCPSNLCSICYKMHLRPKPWRNHTLLKLDEMQDAELKITEPVNIKGEFVKNTEQAEMHSLETASDDINVNEEDECSKHSGKTVEYYCEGHRNLGCSVCMTLSHRICNITYLPSDPSQLMGMMKYPALKTQIEELNVALQESVTKTQCFQQQVEDVAEKAVKDVVAIRNSLVIEINKHQETTLAQLDALKVKDQRYINGILNDLKQIETELKETQRGLDNKEQTRCPSRKLYVAVRQASDAVEEFKQKLKIINEKNTGIIPYKFKPNDKILKVFTTETKKLGWFNISGAIHVDKSNLPKILKTIDALSEKTVKNDEQKLLASNATNSIGLSDLPGGQNTIQASNTTSAKSSILKSKPHTAVQVVKEKKDTSKAPITSKTADVSHQKMGAKIPKGAAGNANTVQGSGAAPVFAEFIKEMNVKAATDKFTSIITGMTMLDGQNMVFCDYQNCCIKIMDINSLNKLTLRIQLNSAPYEAAFTGTELAVTQPHFGTLAIFAKVNEFKLYRNLPVGPECRGIVYHDQKLFVSFKTNPGKVKVLKETGEVLRTFTTVGGDTFHHPCHLAVHPSLPTLYISDWQVTILGLDGSLVRKHRDIDFKELKGLTVSADGNIYVSDRGNNSVYLLSPLATTKQTFLDKRHGIRQPYAVLTTGKKQKKKLFVSMEKSNLIKVYKIATSRD